MLAMLQEVVQMQGFGPSRLAQYSIIKTIAD